MQLAVPNPSPVSMTDSSLDDSANHSNDTLQDGSDSYGDSYPSQRAAAQNDHDGQASEDGESMDAPTLQADAALSLAKQFQKARQVASVRPL